MYEIDKRLEELQASNTPIHVALVGAGQMGKDIIAQIAGMKGMELDVVVDLTADACIDGYRQAETEEEIAVCRTLEEAEAAVSAQKKIAATDYRIAVALSTVQVVIDATGSPEMGARTTMACILHKKHIVMMNVECDVTVGPILRRLCQQAGVVYSLTAGDEPGSIIEVHRFAKALGFTVVAAGKGKNNPLDIYAHPGMAEWKEKAQKRNMAARMLVEFVDGSKTMIEMCAVSNATGLVPDCRGMHGPRCSKADLAKVFSLKSQGGILGQNGVVDYGIGDINPGVFVIVTTQNQRIIDGLVQRDMGDGPNYLLLRPYHLCSIETPITAAQAVLYHESTGHPMDHMTSECITIAKKDIKAGEVLDGIGEYCYRASIDRYEIAKKERLLPVGLAKDAVALVDIPTDTAITYDMVKLPESMLLQLRRMQNQLLG